MSHTLGGTGPGSLGGQAAVACPLLMSCQPCRSAVPGPCRDLSATNAEVSAPVVQGLQCQQCRVCSGRNGWSAVAVMWGLQCWQCEAHDVSNAGQTVPVMWGLWWQRCSV